jgi:hypothetical protein
MKSAFWRSIVVVALVAVPMMANANDATIGSETAYQAMNGGTLMNTTAIFNAFPHLAVNNGNGAELNVNPSSYDPFADEFSTTGFGRLWWEAYDGTWLNFTVGRSDLGIQGTNYMWGGNSLMPFVAIDPVFAAWYVEVTDIAGVGGSAFDRTGRMSPFSDSQWVNLGVARPTAGGGAWAANIMFANGQQKFEDDTTTGDLEDKQTGFGGQFSWGNGEGLHLSAEGAYQKAELVAGDDSIDLGVTNFGVNGRYDTENYIYQGNFVFLSNSISTSAGGDEPSGSTFGFLASAGRFIRNEVDGQATAEFGLAFLNSSADLGSSDNELTSTNFAIPSMRTSVWQKISNRFGLMGGVEWAYVLGSTEDKDFGDAGTQKYTVNGSDFDWSVGMFFQPNDAVRIDAQLREDNLDHILSLGNSEELITYIGATVGLN